jgi:glycosyltransferase involved in cell wall biosynthesis
VRRLLLVTDAWSPQTNGVVTTLQSVTAGLPQHGWSVEVVHPGRFRNMPLPGYPEIRIAIDPWNLSRCVTDAAPDAIHIATEGPLGLAARRWCVRHDMPFSTSLHTKFPEYVEARLGLPPSLGYAFLRWFHNAASTTLCTTPSHRRELESLGLTKLKVWGRGVDLARFTAVTTPHSRQRPLLLYVGRVAVEKNLEAFLRLDIDADKRIVGDGPSREALQARYPDVQWAGYRYGDALVAEYAAADVFVFPSRTDTFGLVMLEAMACGTPVAAFPVTGPVDVVQNGLNGCLHEDLAAAVRGALDVPRSTCRSSAENFDWSVITRRFVESLAIPQQRRDWPKASAVEHGTLRAP